MIAKQKNYDKLTETDTWITDGIPHCPALRGQDGIVTKMDTADADSYVPAETLPDDFLS